MATLAHKTTPVLPATRLVSNFLDSIQEPQTPYISPKRLAEKVGLPLTALARFAGVHRNTLNQNPGSDQLQSKLQEMIKAITAAVELTDDIDKAIYWFRNEPIADYRYKTAAELVAEDQLAAVLAYLDDLRNGATG